MPDTVVQGIRARPGAVTSDVSGITAFSHDLTLSIYRQARGAEPREAADAERAVHDAMDRHAAHLKISREQVRDVVEAALDETRELFTSAKVPMESHRLKELADAARTAMGLSATPTGEWEIEAVDLHDAPGSPALRRRLRQELESKVDASSGAELGEVLLLALEAALRGGPFDRVIACVLSADRTRLTARSGLGTGVEALMTKFDFSMTLRGGPVAALLQQRQPLYVPVDRAPTAQESRWAHQMLVAQFGVFPIIVAGTIVGCLYCDRVAREPMPDRVALEYMKSLCAVVVKAIEARRRAAAVAPPVAPAPALTVVTTQPTTPQPTRTLMTSAPSAEEKSALVLRVLRGESVQAVAESAGVAAAQVEAWREAFLEGAMRRLSDG